MNHLDGEKSELPKCPFCGQPAEAYDVHIPMFGVEAKVICANNSFWMHHRTAPPAMWQSRPIEDALTAERDALKAENDRLRAVLEWYADYDNHYNEDGAPFDEMVEGDDKMDYGLRARAALEDTKP